MEYPDRYRNIGLTCTRERSQSFQVLLIQIIVEATFQRRGRVDLFTKTKLRSIA